MSIDSAINQLNNLVDSLQGKQFKDELRREVNIANKRLDRMNDFQKNIFESKGIEGKISQKGDFNDKLNALAQAKLINESGISTKREYNSYVNKLSGDLSLSKGEVDYMLNKLDSNTMEFMRDSPLKYGTNPQVDFLYEDVVELNDSLDNRFYDIANFITDLLDLADMIINI